LQTSMYRHACRMLTILDCSVHIELTTFTTFFGRLFTRMTASVLVKLTLRYQCLGLTLKLLLPCPNPAKYLLDKLNQVEH